VNWLFDTDIIIYQMKGVPSVARRVEATLPARRYITLITLGELYFGVFRSRRVEANLRRYRRFLTTVKLLPFTPTVAERFGVIKASLANRGEMVADHDIWIAVHALVHGAVLVTNNERHYRRIPDLRIENWTA
jgi:tRNA(fMet)-specific endonuclease VapC